MGATTFSTFANGKTVEEAFSNAVGEAYYWHGHGGYTGTIAEKSGAMAFDIPILPHWTDMDEHKLVEQVQSACDWYTIDGQGHWSHEEGQWISAGDPFAMTYEAGSWQSKAQNDAKQLANAMGVKKFQEMCEIASQKWDDCVAFRISNTTWGFFGWASC